MVARPRRAGPPRPRARGRAAPRPGSRFALFPVEVGRKGDAVAEVAWGGEWYAGPAYEGPRAFETPAEWRAYAGAYRNDSPWYGTWRIVLRKGRLHFSGEPLVPLGGGLFRVGEDATATERMQFSDVVGGRARRLSFSGTDFRRVDE